MRVSKNIYMDFALQSRWTRFLVLFTCLGSDLIFSPVSGCQFEGYGVDKVICSDTDELNKLTPEVMSKVNSIQFKQCKEGQYRLRTNVLAQFTNLTRVQVSCDTATHWTIEKGAFVNSSQIESILMSDSYIVSIPNGEFCHLNKLRILELSNNSIADLDHVGLGNTTETGHECQMTSLEFIRLQYNFIRSLPDDSFLRSLSNLTQISLNDNRITKIGTESLVANHKLTFLGLMNNSLTEIAPRTFQNLTKLEDLSLSNNRLTSLSSQTFSNLQQLKDLRLKYNRIRHLDADVFADLWNMDTLDLSHNLLSTIPDGLFSSMEVLQILFLNNNRLTHLNRTAFTGLAELSYLNLDNNPIIEVHSDTFDSVPYLTWLYFSNSSLTSIPRFPLKHVTEMYLSNASIASVNSTALEQAEQLEILHLNNNSIEVIDEFAFLNLTRLTDLNLAFNRIRFMANNSLKALESLVTLRLEHNKLHFTENIYEDEFGIYMNVFTPLKALVHINLSHNDVTFYRYGWFPENLKNLNLSHNHVKVLSSAGIGLQLALLSIDLSYNRIKHLSCKFTEKYASSQCFPRSVERLLLHDNAMMSVDEKIFENNVNLRQVLFNNNRLRNLKLNTPNFNRDLGMVKLVLGGNPWLCDCHSQWLKQVVHGEEPELLYFVQDGRGLQCERFYHKDKERYASLMFANDDDDYMCSFSNNNTDYCLIWDIKPSKLMVCDHVCPDGCTCYRGIDWVAMNVDCSGRNLTRIHGKFHPITISLFFEHNSIEAVEADDLNVQFRFLQNVYLNNNGLRTIQDGSFRTLHTVRQLYLQSNRLQQLPPNLFSNMSLLTKLDLSDNLLLNLSGHLFEPLNNLRELLLNDNRIHSFPVWQFTSQMPRLASIALEDNPWSCDCEYVASFTNWMKDNAKKLKNAEKTYCMTELQEKVSFIAFNESMCYGGISAVLNRGEVAILATALVVLGTVVVVATLVYVYRSEMKVLIYSRYGVRLFYEADDDDDDQDKLFDAFVSYSSLDEQFIVNEFLPGLEGIDDPYKLCLHHRDFPIGAFISESIFEAVAKSRRTILVLSNNFVHSEWCRFEFRTAHSQMLQDRRNRVVVIILGDLPKELDPEMKLYLRTKTYLSWGDRLFWQKLYFAMPDRGKNVDPTEDEHIM